jgi:hypothetical protein
MTADDLRTQKALAMLELDEAKDAKTTTEKAYQKVVGMIGGASNALSGFHFNDTTTVREKLAPFASVINVDLVVEALQRAIDARVAERAAEQKFSVFRAGN